MAKVCKAGFDKGERMVSTSHQILENVAYGTSEVPAPCQDQLYLSLAAVSLAFLKIKCTLRYFKASLPYYMHVNTFSSHYLHY